MKRQKIKLSLDELQVESFVTSMDADMLQKIAGGFSPDTDDPDVCHPTHTVQTDIAHQDECTICDAIFK